MRSLLSAPIVLGAGGRLGRQVEEHLARLEPATVGATRAEIDITDYFRMREEFERLEPTLVVNCAALADVDRCELDPNLAMRVNAEGASNVARACRETGARLLHVSTDCVLAGDGAEPHEEDEPPAPRSLYGRSKWEGERNVLRECPGALVVRTNWLYGPAGGDFVERTLEGARREKRVGGVVDQVGSPTYTPDVAEALVALARAGADGVVNFVNAGSCTRHEFALRIVEMAGLAEGLAERPLRWAELGRPAPRPENSVLSTARYTALTGLAPRRWERALAAHLAALSAGAGARPQSARAPGGEREPL